MVTRRFDALCATMVSASTFCGASISATNITASTISLTNLATLTATNITATTLCGTNISATNLTSTNISATNITAVNISATTYSNIADASISISAYSEFKEDFLSYFSSPSLGNQFWADNVWTCSNTIADYVTAIPDRNGVVDIINAGMAIYPLSAETTLPYNTNNNPIFEARVKFDVAAVNSIVVGLANIPLSSTIPSSGAFISAGLAKRFQGICRNGAASSTVSSDAAVTATSATWYVVRGVCSPTSCEFFVDGTSIGSVTSNIPSATATGLVFSVGSSNTGFNVDYVYTKQSR